MTRPTLVSRLRTPGVIVPILFLLVGVFGTMWFLHNFERKAVEAFQGESPAARQNVLLAAQEYLKAVGKQASSHKGMGLFSELPPAGDVIILLRMPAGMGRNMTDRLFAWINTGGHLLLVANGTESNHPGADDILKRVGVQLQKSGDDCGCPSSKNKVEKNKAVPAPDAIKAEKNAEDDGGEYHPYNSLIDLTIDGFPVHLKYFNSTLLNDVSGSASFRIDGSFRREYEEEADWKRTSHNQLIKKDGAWLLQYRIGAGKVTVMSEMWLFNNRHIGDFDHAFFLSWLVRDIDRVWLIYAPGSTPLSTILWKRLPYFWISLAVLILLAIWSMQKRTGNLLFPPTDNRRNILAHIDATGQYSWRTGKASTMISENRKNLLRRLAERQLGLQRGREAKDINISQLAVKTGIGEQDLLMAFRSSVVNEQDLIRISRALQKVESIIQVGGQTHNDR